VSGCQHPCRQERLFFANYFSSATTSIFGNFQAIQCNFAVLGATGPAFVSGNVVIEGCTGPSFSSVYGTISGDLECSGNSVGCGAQGSTIGGNAQFDNNGGLDVDNNYIGGNLQCVGNAPSGIFATGGNTVAGNNQGQCAGPSQ